MQVTFTFVWWHIPTALTVLALAWAFFWPTDLYTMSGGISAIFRLTLALLVIALAWAVAGFFK